jgi:hypothetical protein
MSSPRHINGINGVVISWHEKHTKRIPGYYEHPAKNPSVSGGQPVIFGSITKYNRFLCLTNIIGTNTAYTVKKTKRDAGAQHVGAGKFGHPRRLSGPIYVDGGFPIYLRG